MSLNPMVSKYFDNIKSFFKEPFKEFYEEEGLKEKHLEGLIKRKGVSDLLKYRDYKTVNGKEAGLFIMSDFRKGFILRIIPPVFVSPDTEKQLKNLLSSIVIDETVVQFVSYASENILKHIQNYRKFHHCDSNVENTDLLKMMVDVRAEKIQDWVYEPISPVSGLKLRDFHNLLSITFPSDIEDEKIFKIYDEVKSALSEFAPEPYSDIDLQKLLNEIFHREKGVDFWNTYSHGLSLANSIASGGLKITTNKEFQGFKINDKTMARVLTTKSFPKDVSLFEYNNLFFDKLGNFEKVPVNSPFMLSLTILYKDVERNKEKQISRAKHDIAELNKIGIEDMQKEPELRARYEETEEVLYYMQELNEVPLEAMWTLTIFDNDEKNLNESTSAIKQKFDELEWKIVEESSNNIAFLSFLYGLPLQYSETIRKELKKFTVLFKANNASIVPLIGGHPGYGNYNVMMFDRTGQIQRFDPFAKIADNKNILKAGDSGAGKSFSETDFHFNSIAAGYKVRVIDAGESYKHFCNIIGGQYIDFGDNSDISLNFFTKALTKEVDGEIVLHEIEVAAIVSIIGLMAGVNLAKSYNIDEDIEIGIQKGILEAIVSIAVNEAFKRRSFDATLEDVRNIILEASLAYAEKGNTKEADLARGFALSLHKFADKDGEFYKYFNYPNNIDFNKDYVVIETQSLINISKDLYFVVVTMLMQQIRNEFFDPENTGFKILSVDEAKPLLENPITLDIIIQFYRKIRKHNGCINIITQSVNDYIFNEDVQVLYELAYWKWFLKQNKEILGKAAANDASAITPLQKRLIESVKNNSPYYSEAYIKGSNSFMLGRIKGDRLFYWVSTTNGEDKDRIKLLTKKYNISEVDARVACYLVEEGYNEDDAVELSKERKIKQISDEELIEKCNNVVNYAIENNDLISIYTQKIVSKDNMDEVIFSEIFMHIENSEGVKTFDIIKHRDQIRNIRKLENVVLEKVLQFLETRNGVYSLNLSLESLDNGSLINRLLDYSDSKYNDVSNVIIEIPLGNILDSNNNYKETIAKLKRKNYMIINDNLQASDRIVNILKFENDFVKINADLFKDEAEAEFLKIILGAIKLASSEKPIKIIMSRISSKEEYDLVKDLDFVDYLQGFYISEREKDVIL